MDTGSRKGEHQGSLPFNVRFIAILLFGMPAPAYANNLACLAYTNGCTVCHSLLKCPNDVFLSWWLLNYWTPKFPAWPRHIFGNTYCKKKRNIYDRPVHEENCPKLLLKSVENNSFLKWLSEKRENFGDISFRRTKILTCLHLIKNPSVLDDKSDAVCPVRIRIPPPPNRPVLGRNRIWKSFGFLTQGYVVQLFIYYKNGYASHIRFYST